MFSRVFFGFFSEQFFTEKHLQTIDIQTTGVQASGIQTRYNLIRKNAFVWSKFHGANSAKIRVFSDPIFIAFRQNLRVCPYMRTKIKENSYSGIFMYCLRFK